jgi:hypothetical protein
MEKVLKSHLERFPNLGLEMFNNLDNQNLTKCREVSRSHRKFLEDEKLLWTRRLTKYYVDHPEFKKEWKLVMKKVPIEIVKELALAVEQFYTQQPYETRLNYQHSPHHFAAVRGSLSLCKLIAQKTLVLNPPRVDSITLCCTRRTL